MKLLQRVIPSAHQAAFARRGRSRMAKGGAAACDRAFLAALVGTIQPVRWLLTCADEARCRHR